MKKRIIPALLAMLMVLSLAGCGKTTATVTFDEAESVSIANMKSISGSSGSTHDNVLELTSTKNGEFPILVLVDGEEVTVTVTFKNGDADVVTDPQMDFTYLVK